MSGGVRSSIEHLLLSKQCYTHLIEVSTMKGTARERNGHATGNHLSGTGCAPNLSHMHGPDTMRGLFPPAAIDTGIEMGHQSIQHIKHTLRKHRALTLLALTHLILQFSHGLYIIRHGSWFSSFPVKFFDFFIGKEELPCLPCLGLSRLTAISRIFLMYYTAGGVNARCT
jgi:hypothetical protein